MTPWQWWAAEAVEAECGQWTLGEFDTRAVAIESANREYPAGTQFYVIEARSSESLKYEEVDVVPFLRSRNKECLTATPQPHPLGTNPKLDELMVLVAVSAATESGNGYDLDILKREAKRATELWNARPTQAAPDDEDAEMVARAEAAIQLIADGNFYEDYDQSTAALGDLRKLLASRQSARHIPAPEALREAVERLTEDLERQTPLDGAIEVYADDLRAILASRLPTITEPDGLLSIAREAAIPAHRGQEEHIRSGGADDWITVRSALRAARAALSASPLEERGLPRMFRMQKGPAIPWATAETIYAAYSTIYGGGQSLERLNERGGFGWNEVEVIFANLARRYPAKHKELLARADTQKPVSAAKRAGPIPRRRG